MTIAIGFDVYGTLVDPLEMAQHLYPLMDEIADRFAKLWREKQLEYSFRRGLMEQYENFSVCTWQALQHTMKILKVDLSLQDQNQLMEVYQNLQPYADVLPGLTALRQQNYKLVAFSNGMKVTVQTLLTRSNILPYLDAVISVDDLQTFKPNPTVYKYLVDRVERPAIETWLVSSNSWDVIGAKAAGLRAVWLQRTSDQVFDPWDIEPDLIVANLEELSQCLAPYSDTHSSIVTP